MLTVSSTYHTSTTLLPCAFTHLNAAVEVWDVPQAVEYMKKLEPLKPWFIEEPTAPDDVVGHANIRKQLKPYGIGVATGEHAHNRVSIITI
jgi:L-alanine-DL-glutamate epimerase-like enolase superfamily enzyme